MSGLFSRGMKSLASRLQTAGGGAIVYAVGLQTVSLNAVFGRSEYQIDMGMEVRVLHTDRDFLVSRSELILNGSSIEPVPGHRVTDVATGEVFETMPLGPDPCWKPCDQFGEMIRIHTKRVA